LTEKERTGGEHAAMPLHAGERPAPRFMRAVGVAFCCMWALSILAFPWLKEQINGYLPVAAGVLMAAALIWRPVRRRVDGLLQRPSTPWFLVVVTALALALRLGAMLLAPEALSSDSLVYDALAANMISGSGYGQTAYLSPGYPALLAGWYFIFGGGAKQGYMLGILLGTTAVPLIYDVGRRAIGPAAGRWAALLLSVMPTLVFTSPRVHTTTTLVLLVLATMDLFLLGGRERLAWGWSLVLGLVTGFAVLVRPTFLLAPSWLAPAWLVRTHWRRTAARTALFAAGMLAVVAPWTARNYLVLGAFVPVSTNGGYNLYNGMNPDSDGLWSRREPLPGEHDEVSRDRLRRRAALRWAAENPGPCARLMVRKQAYMWGTSSTNIGDGLSRGVPESFRGLTRKAIKFSCNAFFVMLMILAFRSTVLTGVWRNPRLLPGLLFVLVLFGIHLLFEVQSRYNIPALPVMMLLASAGPWGLGLKKPKCYTGEPVTEETPVCAPQGGNGRQSRPKVQMGSMARVTY